MCHEAVSTTFRCSNMKQAGGEAETSASAPANSAVLLPVNVTTYMYPSAQNLGKTWSSSSHTKFAVTPGTSNSVECGSVGCETDQPVLSALQCPSQLRRIRFVDYIAAAGSFREFDSSKKTPGVESIISIRKIMVISADAHSRKIRSV